MYALINTFTDSIISRHRSEVAAEKAQGKLARQLASKPGNSYLSTTIRRWIGPGQCPKVGTYVKPGDATLWDLD